MCINDFSKYSWIHFPREKSDTFDAFEPLFIRLMLEKKIFIIRRLYELGVITRGSLRTLTLTIYKTKME